MQNRRRKFMKQQENTIKGVFDFLAIASDPNKTIDF